MDKVLCCATCHVKVTHVRDPDGRDWWGHPTPMDHEVVPVPLEENEAIRVCDFCLLPNPGWAIPLLDHANTTGWDEQLQAHVTSLDMDGWWAACDICKELVVTGQKGKLRDRAFDVHAGVVGQPLEQWQRAYIIEQLRAFWTATPGSPVEASTLQVD